MLDLLVTQVEQRLRAVENLRPARVDSEPRLGALCRSQACSIAQPVNEGAEHRGQTFRDFTGQRHLHAPVGADPSHRFARVGDDVLG